MKFLAALGVPEKHLNRTVYISNKPKSAAQQGWGVRYLKEHHSFTDAY